MSVITINFHFLKNWELSFEVFINKFFDFLRTSTLLAEELIAREGQNLEPFRSELFMHMDHSLIVRWSQSSLACYIDNHNCLSIFESWKVNKFSRDVLDFEVIEWLSFGCKFLLSTLKKDWTHILYINIYKWGTMQLNHIKTKFVIKI